MSALPCTSAQRDFQDGLKTYARAVRENSAQPPAFQLPVNARAKKRSFGFSFGKFALDYTSQDLKLDTEKISAQKQDRDAWVPHSSLDLETSLKSFSPGQNPEQNLGGEPSALDIRLGLLAYAQSALSPGRARPGTLIGVA